MHKFTLGVFLCTIDLDGAMFLSRLFACLVPCKGIQDSLGFWIPSRGFRIPATGFRFRCQWILDSGLQSLVGSRYFVKPWILDSTSKDFQGRVVQSWVKITQG